MRWIWAVVVACLVATAPVRPASPRDDGDPTTLEVAAIGLPAIVHRRDGAHAPELRLTAIAPAAVVELEPPVVFALVRELAVPLAPHLVLIASRSSRGPPIALAS